MTTDRDQARPRWTQVIMVLRWRRVAPDLRQRMMAALHEQFPSALRCLAVITPVGDGQSYAGMDASHWHLLAVAEPVLRSCIITVHDLDEPDLVTGILSILAFDAGGELKNLPPSPEGHEWWD